MRDEFPLTIKKLIAERVAYHCSNPNCNKVTAGPKKDPKKVINIGVAAHMTAASTGGPRYDPSLTPKARRSPENGIWLCQSCAKLVDSDPIKYEVDLLRQWKEKADINALYELEHGRLQTANDKSNLSTENTTIQPTIDWTTYIKKVRQLNEIPCYISQNVRLDTQSINLEEALKTQPCLYVVGPAGAGKTANLRQTHIRLLDQVPQCIPLWIQLDLYEPQIGLLELIHQGLEHYKLQLTEAELKCLLKSTDVVLFMDGWTEVFPEHRDCFRKEFLKWCLECPHHKYIISGRRNEIYGNSNDASLGSINWSTVELQPFSDIDLKSYLTKSLGSNIELKTLPPLVKEAARWPLYAKMIAQIWKVKSHVDTTCVTELVEIALTRELSKSAGVLSSSLRDELDEFMIELSSDMQQQLMTVIPRYHARELIKAVWSRLKNAGRITTSEEITIQAVFESPLIISEENRIRFAHQIFQEFFAGHWLATNFQSENEQCKSLIVDPWWTYPVVFAAAKVTDNSLLKIMFQSRNLWAISRCLAGDAGERPRDYCRTAINSILDKNIDDRKFAVRCLIETIDNPWSFENLLKVISEEDHVRENKEFNIFLINDTVLSIALRPFNLFDYRITRLPLDQIFTNNLSRTARWAFCRSLHHIAVLGQYGENRNVLMDLLVQLYKDPSRFVVSEAIDGLGSFACHEKSFGNREVPKIVIDTLNEAASSGHWPEYQTAFEYLLRSGEAKIDEEWTKNQIKNIIQNAETCLSDENTEYGASLAVNIYDEIIGAATIEAIEQLGDEKFE